MTPSDYTNSLKEAIEECARLREENRRLKALLGIREEDTPLQSKTKAITNDSPTDAKISLSQPFPWQRRCLPCPLGREKR